MFREIILMRHGQPALASVARVSLRDMRNWIADYEQSTITDLAPTASSLVLAERARHVVSSNAPRALASLQRLALEPCFSDALFGEAQLPHGRWSWPRLSPFTWAFVLRLRWMGGYNGEVESARHANDRAKRAAAHLQSLADQGPVLLMGHGFMNRLIGKQLQASGWSRHTRDGQGYWSAAVYRQPIQTRVT